MAFLGFHFFSRIMMKEDNSGHQQGAKLKGLRPRVVALLHISPITAAP